MFPYYDPHVSSNLATPSPLVMIASYAASGSDASVNVQITVDQSVTTTNNVVHFCVIEDDVHNHANMARMMLADEVLTITAPGETVSINRTFTLDPGWKPDDVEVVVWVQSSIGQKQVVQATKAVPNYVGTITVATAPAGLGAEWTLTGPNGYNIVGVDGRILAVFDEGDYTVTYGDVPGWESPDPVSFTDTMIQDGSLTFTGTYVGGPFTALATGSLGYNGQGSGVAIIDFDGDSDLDIQVINTGEADLLLRNDGGHTFTNVAAGVTADVGAGMAAAWADYDNDGDLDYYLSKNGEANLLVRNDGGSFVGANMGTIGNTGPGAGVAWADYNLDGMVDVYLCNTGAANVLYKAYGPLGLDWLFLESSGGVNDAGNSACPTWVDFDNDGDSDLFFTTRSGQDRLFENAGSFGFYEFSNSTINNPGNGSGCAWADYDHDGDMDLYAAVDGSSDRLVRNMAGTSFVPAIGTPASAVANTRGVAWADYDNDGDLDLYQAKSGQYDRLLLNQGGGVFVVIPLGIDAAGGAARGAAWGDTDGDGDLDLYLVNAGSSNVLMQNDLDNGNHWLHLRLTGTTSNVSAIGTIVELTTGGVTQRREVTAGSGYCSQNSLDVEFGLGTATSVESLVITWPSGTVQNFSGVPIDQLIELNEDVSTGLEDGDTGDTPAQYALHSNYPNPFNPLTTFAFELPRPGRTTAQVYDVSGRLVKVLLNQDMPAGTHSIQWNGNDGRGQPVGSGTYFLRLSSGAFRSVKEMTLLK